MIWSVSRVVRLQTVTVEIMEFVNKAGAHGIHLPQALITCCATREGAAN